MQLIRLKICKIVIGKQTNLIMKNTKEILEICINNNKKIENYEYIDSEKSNKLVVNPKLYL